MSDVPFLPLLSTAYMAPLLCWAIAWNLISKPFVSIARAMKWIPTPSLKQYDLANKVCIVTGSNTGVGKRTAFHLARMGGSVILACRSKERADSAKTELIKELQAAGVKSPKLEVMLVDLSDTKSVRKFAAAFKEKHKRLDILVNNGTLSACFVCMCIRMYVYACVYVCVYLRHVYTQSSIYVHPHTYMAMVRFQHVCMRTCMFIRVISLTTRLSIHAHKYMYACMSPWA